jgi:DNA-binding MarR family transcriptional regulator
MTSNHQDDIEKTVSVIFRAIRFLKQKEMHRGNCMLSQARFETLSFISEAKLPTMNDLAKYFRITAPSATSLVEHLVKAKQLTRVPDPKDHRQVRLALTFRGQRDLKQAMAIKHTQWRSLLKKLSGTERVQLANIFKKLSREETTTSKINK